MSYNCFWDQEMDFLWLQKCLHHCKKHQVESPEICPDFIENLMVFGSPSRIYGHKTYPYRHVFEGYYPPKEGRPYRVIFEVTDSDQVVPIACWRIRDKEYMKWSR